MKNLTCSAKHKGGKTRLSKRDTRQKEIAVKLRAHDATRLTLLEKTTKNTTSVLCKVATAFHCSAIPLSKQENFKEILEEGGYRLTDRHKLSDFIPFIHSTKGMRVCLV